MTVLVGSDVPGLLTALEQAFGGSQRLTVVHNIDTIAAILSDRRKRVDALILSDSITPPSDVDIATALWNIVSDVARVRQPTIPTVLTLSDATPPVILDALRAEAQRTGGEVYLVPRGMRNSNQANVQPIVASITSHLKLERQCRQFRIVGVCNAGGLGMTSTIVNVGLQLVRLGLRVLLVDCDSSGNALDTWLRVQPGSDDDGAELPEQALARRIVHHQSGLDILFAPHESPKQWKLDGLLGALEALNYDVVALDGVRDWYARPDVIAVLAQESTSPFVICPAGAKERAAALVTLQKLRTIEREGVRTSLNAAMLVFVEGERGQVADIRRVKRDVLQQYPMVTDLGTLPRDPALLSMVAERAETTTVFDLAPRRSYCHAIRRATRRWTQAVELPATWLTQRDPYERFARTQVWSFRRSHTTKSTKASQPALEVVDVKPSVVSNETSDALLRSMPVEWSYQIPKPVEVTLDKAARSDAANAEQSEAQALAAACQTALSYAHAHHARSDLGRAINLLRPFDALALPSELAQTLLLARRTLLAERIEAQQQAAFQQQADSAELAQVDEQLHQLHGHRDLVAAPEPIQRTLAAEPPTDTSGLTPPPTSTTIQATEPPEPVNTNWLDDVRQHNRARARLRAVSLEGQE